MPVRPQWWAHQEVTEALPLGSDKLSPHGAFWPQAQNAPGRGGDGPRDHSAAAGTRCRGLRVLPPAGHRPRRRGTGLHIKDVLGVAERTRPFPRSTLHPVIQVESDTPLDDTMTVRRAAGTHLAAVTGKKGTAIGSTPFAAAGAVRQPGGVSLAGQERCGIGGPDGSGPLRRAAPLTLRRADPRGHLASVLSLLLPPIAVRVERVSDSAAGGTRAHLVPTHAERAAVGLRAGGGSTPGAPVLLRPEEVFPKDLRRAGAGPVQEHHRSSVGLTEWLRSIAVELGGRPVARLCRRLRLTGQRRQGVPDVL